MENIRTPKVDKVRLLDRSSGQRKISVGTLYLSATHTIFVDNNPETRKETWVLHSMVSSVERLPPSPAGSQLILRCKDFQVFQILVPQERDCVDVHASLVRLSRPEKYSELYCLSFNPNVNKEQRAESWAFIDLVADYKRMGVPNNLWVATAANSEYRVCDTYPSQLFVPKSATPTVIVGSSRFRSRGRFPALSYFHQDTLAAVCRCSQPLSGFSGRSQEDEMMLQAVMKSNPGSDFIWTEIPERCPPSWTSSWSVCGSCRSSSRAPSSSTSASWSASTRTSTRVSTDRSWETARRSVRISVWNQNCVNNPAHESLNPTSSTGEEALLLEGHFCARRATLFTRLLRERTHSLWPQMWKIKGDFMNPLYKAELSQTQGVLRPNTSPYCFKMWKGLYNKEAKSTPPPQSPADFLSAVREESTQLEEQLTNHQEKMAALTGKPITWEKIEVPRSRVRSHRGPDPPTTYTDPNTHPTQDNACSVSSELANQKPALTPPTETRDPDDLSTCSDRESGVADLSSRSSSGGDYGKDPDLD